MNERRRIEERVRQKEMEIQELESKSRDAKIYLQALQDVLKIIPREISHSLGAKALRPGSSVFKAREVMLSVGHPMHITDLLTALEQPVNREARASLSSSLASYVRRGEMFTRPAPNTFGLAELGHPNVLDEDPPEDFGAEPSHMEDHETTSE